MTLSLGSILLFLAAIGSGYSVPNEFGHYASIYRGSSSLQYHICSGVIVHPNWVLTGDTCYARVTKVVAGDLNEEAEEGTEQKVTLDAGTYVKHPTYPVVLLKVTPGFQYNDHVSEAVFAPAEVLASGNTVKVIGKNPATNGGYFQRVPQSTNLTVEAKSSCTFTPAPPGPEYSCLVGGGPKRCSGERGSPVQCQVGTDNFFCGMVINKGECFKSSPTDNDPPAIIAQPAIHSEALKTWIAQTINPGH